MGDAAYRRGTEFDIRRAVRRIEMVYTALADTPTPSSAMG
jgi:hypothetical protein